MQIGRRARWLTTAQLSGRTGRTALPLGGWLHNVRSASHGARLPLVRLHSAELPSLPQVSSCQGTAKAITSLYSTVGTPPPACTMRRTRTAPWVDHYPARCSRWMRNAGEIVAPMRASRMSVSVRSSSASTPRRATVLPTGQQPRAQRVVMAT